MPKVSVIVPVYNVEKYLRECLDSIVAQTLKDIEIICVNDGSTDNSAKILEEYALKDKRIIVVSHEKNKGRASSRNTALKCVSSPYIMSCDSDDMFVPTACEKMYNAVIKNKVDVAICGIQVFYETETPKNIRKSDKQYYSIKAQGIKKVDDALIQNVNASLCSKIVSASLVKEKAIEFPVGLNYEDAYFHFVYMPWVENVFFISENLYKYRRRANSIMSETFSGKSHAEDHLQIALKIYEYYQKHNLLNKKYELFWRCFCDFYWLAYIYTQKTSEKVIIHKKAVNFIKKNCEVLRLSSEVQNRINDICRNGVSAKNELVLKFLNFIPLLSVKSSPNKKVCKILGVPLLKLKRKANKTKIYVLGIPLFKLVNQ